MDRVWLISTIVWSAGLVLLVIGMIYDTPRLLLASLITIVGGMLFRVFYNDEKKTLSQSGKGENE